MLMRLSTNSKYYYAAAKSVQTIQLWFATDKLFLLQDQISTHYRLSIYPTVQLIILFIEVLMILLTYQFSHQSKGQVILFEVIMVFIFIMVCIIHSFINEILIANLSVTVANMFSIRALPNINANRYQDQILPVLDSALYQGDDFSDLNYSPYEFNPKIQESISLTQTNYLSQILFFFYNLIALLLTHSFQQTFLVTFIIRAEETAHISNHKNIIYQQAFILILQLQHYFLIQGISELFCFFELAILVIMTFIQIFFKVNCMTKFINIARNLGQIIIIICGLTGCKFQWLITIIISIIALIASLAFEYFVPEEIYQMLIQRTEYFNEQIEYEIPSKVLHCMKMSENPITSGIYKSQYEGLERSKDQFFEGCSASNYVENLQVSNNFYESIFRIYEAIYSNIILTYIHSNQVFKAFNMIDLEQSLSVQELFYYAKRWKTNPDQAYNDICKLMSILGDMIQQQGDSSTNTYYNNDYNDQQQVQLGQSMLAVNEQDTLVGGNVIQPILGTEFLLQNNEVYFCSSLYLTSNVTGITHKIQFNSPIQQSSSIYSHFVKLVGLINYSRLLFPYQKNGTKFYYAQTFTVKEIAPTKLQYQSCGKRVFTPKDYKIIFNANPHMRNKILYNFYAPVISSLLSVKIRQSYKQFMMAELYLSMHIENVYLSKIDKKFTSEFSEACNRAILVNIAEMTNDPLYKVPVPLPKLLANDAIICSIADSFSNVSTPTIDKIIAKLCNQIIPYKEGLSIQTSNVLQGHYQEYGVLSKYNIEKYYQMVEFQQQIIKQRYTGDSYNQVDLEVLQEDQQQGFYDIYDSKKIQQQQKIQLNSKKQVKQQQKLTITQLLSNKYQYYEALCYLYDTIQSFASTQSKTTLYNILNPEKEKLYNSTDAINYIYQLLGLQPSDYIDSLTDRIIDQFNHYITSQMQNCNLENDTNLNVFKIQQNYQIQDLKRNLSREQPQSIDSIYLQQIVYFLTIFLIKKNSQKVTFQNIETISKIQYIYSKQTSEAVNKMFQLKINNIQNLQEDVKNKIYGFLKWSENWSEIFEKMERILENQEIEKVAGMLVGM